MLNIDTYETAAEQKPPYSMPCPQCRRLIDARVHLCPHCGVDTDKSYCPRASSLRLSPFCDS